MRKVREVLRLHHVAGSSARAIARSLKVSPVTVRRYLSRAEELGLGWPLPEWTQVHRELRRNDVTLALLWEESKAAHPHGLQCSQFCERDRAWASTLDAVMRFEHRAGETMFVDYAGRTVAVVERETGEIRQAQVFVAVLGASRATHSPRRRGRRPCPTGSPRTRTRSKFFGGCAELAIPDDVPRNIIGGMLPVESGMNTPAACITGPVRGPARAPSRSHARAFA